MRAKTTNYKYKTAIVFANKGELSLFFFAYLQRPMCLYVYVSRAKIRLDSRIKQTYMQEVI